MFPAWESYFPSLGIICSLPGKKVFDRQKEGPDEGPLREVLGTSLTYRSLSGMPIYRAIQEI